LVGSPRVIIWTDNPVVSPHDYSLLELHVPRHSEVSGGGGTVQQSEAGGGPDAVRVEATARGSQRHRRRRRRQKQQRRQQRKRAGSSRRRGGGGHGWRRPFPVALARRVTSREGERHPHRQLQRPIARRRNWKVDVARTAVQEHAEGGGGAGHAAARNVARRRCGWSRRMASCWSLAETIETTTQRDPVFAVLLSPRAAAAWREVKADE
jgi:hypothetical protein